MWLLNDVTGGMEIRKSVFETQRDWKTRDVRNVVENFEKAMSKGNS